jgi:outer membrane lipoprotein carrier protein
MLAIRTAFFVFLCLGLLAPLGQAQTKAEPTLATKPALTSENPTTPTTKPAEADPKAKETAAQVEKLHQKYKSIKNFQVEFVQKTSNKMFKGRGETSTGLLLFEKPGKMRWDYLTPTKQQIFMGNNQIAIYKPEDNQAIMAPLSGQIQSKDVLALLTGDGDIRKGFRITGRENPAAKESVSFELIPLDDSVGIERLLLTVSKKDFVIEQSVLYDLLGNSTEINYKNYRIDSNTFDPKTFSFTPPQGVEIINSPY